MPHTAHMTQPNIVDRPTFVSHLECAATGERYPADTVHGLSRVGKPLLVRYDLDRVRDVLSRAVLAARAPDMWKWREMLPVRATANIVSLGEVATPLVPVPVLGDRHGAVAPIVKDEGRLPTGSFKARGLVMAVSMAKELGIRRIAMPTNGNAGAAMAAYCAAAGIESYVFCPDDTPEVNVREIALQGAKVWRVNGLIGDCGRIVGDGREAMGWFDLSTLKEPYRIEGKKTMGLELVEQLGWQVPDVIFYPTGGGTGLIGMWKAFAELEAIGLIGPERPRMVAVQASGCAPIVNAWKAGADHAEPVANAHTVASGIRVPGAIGDFLILNAVRESGGFAIAVDDDAIIEVRDRVAREGGFLLCPEGAATAAAWEAALDQGLIARTDRAVLYNCASGLKYPMPPADAAIDRHQPIDWAAIR
ncbi:threonine synthase [Sphingomonas flavalba]|uniref:threonine synthase n=1 Tax=Sphingomonas flavalba TaxID=2559804 RepID=UPI0039E08E0B